MTRMLQFCAVIGSLLSALALHGATTITVRPDGTGTSNGDTFVTTGPSNNLTANNYGGGGAVAVSAAGLPQGEEKSVFRFDVSSVKSSFDSTYGVGAWTVTGVQLELTAVTPNSSVFNSPNAAGSFLVQWVPTDSWVEGSGTPAVPSASGLNWTGMAALTSGAESEGSLSFSGSLGTADYSLSPSSGLLGDISSGGQASFILSAADATMTAVFNSRSFPTSSSRPALIVTASALSVPEPGRTLFLVLGLVAGLLRRRRVG